MHQRCTKKIPGITVQAPWAQLLVSGKKVIETRHYPIPRKYIGKKLAIIETPGKRGNFKRRIVGFVIFDGSFIYESEKSFNKDYKLHLVGADSDFAWDKKGKKNKWGWKVAKAESYSQELPISFRTGIKFSVGVPIFN